MNSSLSVSVGTTQFRALKIGCSIFIHTVCLAASVMLCFGAFVGIFYWLGLFKNLPYAVNGTIFSGGVWNILFEVLWYAAPLVYPALCLFWLKLGNWKPDPIGDADAEVWAMFLVPSLQPLILLAILTLVIGVIGNLLWFALKAFLLPRKKVACG